jgi:hypothetical protein
VVREDQHTFTRTGGNSIKRFSEYYIRGEFVYPSMDIYYKCDLIIFSFRAAGYSLQKLQRKHGG